jgi:hypothetical protein
MAYSAAKVTRLTALETRIRSHLKRKQMDLDDRSRHTAEIATKLMRTSRHSAEEMRLFVSRRLRSEETDSLRIRMWDQLCRGRCCLSVLSCCQVSSHGRVALVLLTTD